MSAIFVSHLSKYYQIHKKEPGIIGSFKSFFARKYEEVKAVEDISFKIEEGELIGFIGPNGAGKTTTLKCLSGLLYPTKGEISVLGFTPYKRDNQYLKQIALVMGQKNQLWWDLPAMESFLLNKKIYEIPDEKFDKTLNELSTLLEITDILNVQVRKLSLGQRMKCELIAALIHRPKVLFLDEPTIGLDVVMQKNLRDFVRVYNKDYKATIILTSHYMRDVEQLCKRIIIIDRGKIIYDGMLSDIIKRYATHKIISIELKKKIDSKNFLRFGEILSDDFPRVTIKIDRGKSNLAASKILKEFAVSDINIEEPQIEEVIRHIFSKK